MAAKEPIEAVIFDFFGVLASYNDQIVCRPLAAACADPPSALAALDDIMSDRALITGRLSLEALHELARRAHDFAPAGAAFWSGLPYAVPHPHTSEPLPRVITRCR